MNLLLLGVAGDIGDALVGCVLLDVENGIEGSRRNIAKVPGISQEKGS
jgi:hypothetical protein